MKKAILMILDGWGIGDKSRSDVIAHSNVPFVTGLYNHPDWAYTTLVTYGEQVGLPEGQMGNSEVGHLNIGAGRVVYQDFLRINIAVRDGSIAEQPALVEALEHAQREGKAVHFLGLVSDGGVHSHTRHLMKLCDVAKQHGLHKVFIHALTDGRDTDPRSGAAYVQELEDHLKGSVGQIASVCGRYYGMDRDKRWERVKKYYDAIVHGIGAPAASAAEAIQASYDAGLTDEFILPAIITDAQGKPTATLQPGDVVIGFNFRTDRLRQITIALTQKAFPEHGMEPMDLHYVTMTRYDDKFQGIKVIYDKDNLQNTLGEVLAEAGRTQIRIAETEKYPHVTFFFSGGRENEFPGERRLMVASPKVPTYDLQPEMSAPDIRDAIVPELRAGAADFVCLNFANPDMVGHTGVYEAIQKAVETVDQCAQAVVEAAQAGGYSIIIIADHGNADYAINPDGSPNTAHSTNPVPCLVFDPKYEVQEGQARQARRHRPHAPDPHGHGDSQGNDRRSARELILAAPRPARTGIRRPPPGAAADARPSFFGDVAFPVFIFGTP